jgi:hypothetical protein
VKTKTRLVHHEDDRRVAVPPQFAIIHGALCDWLLPVHAVTGNPVPFYFRALIDADFFGKGIRRLRHCFPADASTVRILLYQDSTCLLLLNNWDYTLLKMERQGIRFEARTFLFHGTQTENKCYTCPDKINKGTHHA